MKKLFIMCVCVIFLGLITVSAFAQDTDGDGVPDSLDNCPTDYNPVQEDNYPPGGNDCGDACECEGNFDGDDDQEGSDAVIFNADMGRTDCTDLNPCNGDFDCDGDVDDDDQTKFMEDFGRNTFFNPCPPCVTQPWCVYDQDGDGISDAQDNCPNHPNGPLLGTCIYGTIGTVCTSNGECDITGGDGFCDRIQADNYPPGGNNLGDACECEGDFNRDGNVDGGDVGKFLEDFGRSQYNNPCP